MERHWVREKWCGEESRKVEVVERYRECERERERDGKRGREKDIKQCMKHKTNKLESF